MNKAVWVTVERHYQVVGGEVHGAIVVRATKDPYGVADLVGDFSPTHRDPRGAVVTGNLRDDIVVQYYDPDPDVVMEFLERKLQEIMTAIKMEVLRASGIPEDHKSEIVVEEEEVPPIADLTVWQPTGGLPSQVTVEGVGIRSMSLPVSIKRSYRVEKGQVVGVLTVRAPDDLYSIWQAVGDFSPTIRDPRGAVVEGDLHNGIKVQYADADPAHVSEYLERKLDEIISKIRAAVARVAGIPHSTEVALVVDGKP